MTRTATQGLVMVGPFVVLLAAVTAMFADLDRGGARGALIGAALGLVNLGVGSLLTRRALGPQPDDVGGARIWLLPNPSGAQAHYQFPELAEAFAALRRAAETR